MAAAPVDGVGSNLRAMRAGIEQARTAAASAQHEAERVAGQAAAGGFSGIVAGMIQVRNALKELQAGLAGVTGALDETTATVVPVPWEASPAEVLATLGRAGDKLRTVQDGIGAATAKADEVATLVARVLAGGDPGRLLGALGTVKETLTAVRQQAGTVDESLTAAAATARQVGTNPGS